jgi:hypothetical protein
LGKVREGEGREGENSKDLEIVAGIAGGTGAGSSRSIEKTIGRGASSRVEMIRGISQEVAKDYR